MQTRTIRRYTFEHRPLHFGQASGSDFEYLSIETHYDEKGNITDETKYLPDGKPEEVNRFAWSPEGRMTEHVMEMVSEGMQDVIRYEHDAAGRVVKEQKHYGDDPGEAVLYAYNENGDIVEIRKTDADGDFESCERFEYNDKGSVIRRLATAEDGTIQQRSEMDYDTSGNLSERRDYDAGGNLVSRTEYAYNGKNAVEAVIQRNAEGKLTESVRYRYDERDNVVEKEIRDFHPRTFRFTFNEKNECTEEMVYDQNGQLNTKRLFEYDDAGRLLRELTYHMDVNRGDLNKGHRFEYEFYPA